MAWLTVGSGVAFGTNFVVLHQVPPEANLWPLVFGRLSATAIVIVVGLVTANLILERGAPLRLALFAGVLDAVANIATLLALQSSLRQADVSMYAGMRFAKNTRRGVPTVVGGAS